MFRLRCDAGLIKDQFGGLAVIFAVAMLPLTFAAGAAIDASRLMIADSHLQDALDAATLAAARAKDDGGNIQDVRAEGERFFSANCQLEELCSRITTIEFDFEEDGVSGFVSGQLPLHFMQVVGIEASSIGANNKAVLPDYIYETFYFAIDMSASMGIAADQANRLLLEAATRPYVIQTPYVNTVPEGCTFACHSTLDFDAFHSYANSYELARANGISLREDILLEDVWVAASAILNTAPVHKSEYTRVAAYGFSNDLELLTGPTNDQANFRDAIENATISRFGTDYDAILPELATLVGLPGAGGSPASPLKTIILLTDGVLDTHGSGGARAIGPIDPITCNQVKDLGVRLVVVDITYVDLTGNYFFDRDVLAHYDDVSPALQQCASPGFYYSGGDPEQIEAALAQMVNELTTGQIRLAR